MFPCCHWRNYLDLLKNVKKDGFLGTRVYIEGYNSTDTEKDRIDIYCVDTQSGEIEKVIENIEPDRAFKAIYSWDSKSQQMIDSARTARPTAHGAFPRYIPGGIGR